MKLNTLFQIGLIAISIAACRKKDPPTPSSPSDNTGRLTVNVSNVAGDQPLVLNTAAYANANGDTFTVTNYAYYITNVSLLSETGLEFAETESYHLIKEDTDSSKTFSIQQIPPGTYSAIKFLIGVDEARNTSGAQTGALDPMHSMFWDWNSGYIMAKLEGSSPQSTGPANFIGFHLGGFSGPQSVLRWVTLTFPEPIHIASGKTPELHIQADVLKWFGPTNIIDFSEINIIMGPGLAASQIADNYAHMFTITQIHP